MMNLSLEQIKNIIQIMPVIISILSFLLVPAIAGRFHPGQAVQKTYIKVNNRLKEKNSGFFQYEKLKKFLEANGATYHYGTWINPILYMALRLCIGAILFVIAIRFHPILSILAAIIGFQLPGMLLNYLNQRDNQTMLTSIQTLFSALQVQMKAGVYVTDALAECYRSIEKGRLREALKELSGEIFMKGSFEDAIDNFNGKFNNSFIDSLCIILKQAQESGQAVDLLSDMSEQIEDMRAAMQLKKKEELERTTTFCLLGLLASTIGVILYAFITTMYQSLSLL